MIKKGVDPLENAIVEGSALKMEQTMDDLMDGGKVQPRTARFLTCTQAWKNVVAVVAFFFDVYFLLFSLPILGASRLSFFFF